MSPPTLYAAPLTPASTAAQAMNLSHSKLYAALGAVCVLAWFVIHHFAAHRHPVAEWIAKVCLVAGGVVLAVSVGGVAGWIGSVNDTTASWLSSWLGDPTFANKHWGLLTILAVIDVAFVLATTYDLIRHMTAKKGGGGAGGIKSVHPRWGTLESTANKYGWFGLGPLAVTLPAPFGLWVVTWLSLLSEAIAHFLGKMFGMG